MLIKATKQLRFPALLTLFAAVVSGCSLAPPKSLMDVQSGDVFELKQPVTITAGKARQYIQAGHTRGGFDHSEPHCRLEIYALQPSPSVIAPERFAIHRVQLGEEQIAGQIQTLQLAQNRYQAIRTDAAEAVNLLAMMQERPETMDLVHLYLSSDTQPNVYRLTCAGALSNGSLMDAPRSYRPQKAAINAILGNVGHIDSAAQRN